ncbi:MAG: MATE family efflux transporter [Clostridia bacterium]|nr:MATE family efflux transporter [Clostridia bacterium]
MDIKLSDHFTYQKLLRFTLPSIAMMIFTSIYGVVDGFFVSNFVGKTPFAAVNFIMPLLMILGSLGFMFGTGGCALVSKYMGEGDRARANRVFSMLVYVSFGVGVLIAILGILFLRPIASLLGASGKMLDDCVTYGRIILIAIPAFMLQMEFQSFFTAAEKPKLGLYVTVASGLTNIVLDALLVGIFPMGLVGAATATAISQAVGGLFPLIYFARPNSGLLRLTAFSFDGISLLKTCTNGSSELMSNISMSLVGMLYNIQLMKYEGEDGVAAYGVLMYVSMIFMAAFIGYIIGTAPIISYHYGAQNHDELKSLRKKSLRIIWYASIAMLILGEILSQPLSFLFVSYDPKLYDLTLRGFFFYSFSFLFCGIAIFGSGFFTALNNGLVSAIISFLRTLVFQVVAVLLFPLIFGIDGIWLSIVFAELAAAIITLAFMKALQKRYHY